MDPIKLEQSYHKNKEKFHGYINNIKRINPNIYTIVNYTLVTNPYASDFPKNYFLENVINERKSLLFLKSFSKYYFKSFVLFFSFLVSFTLFKIYYKKKRVNDTEILIDVFGLVDKVNSSGYFTENYLPGITDILDKKNIKYSFLLRLYGINKNPFKLIKFFKIMNDEKRDFIFEYELFKITDFYILLKLIILYPFKTFNLLQNEKKIEDKVFNHSLIKDIENFSIDAFTRYILGKNISKIKTINEIYSWSEFQVIERSFNYGIRSNNKDIKVTACQFYLNYETYFNAYVDDLDFENLSSPHKVLVNGKYYILKKEKIDYRNGVALRYKPIFNFKGIKEEKYILVLGSYIIKDTKYMLDSVSSLENIIFKSHPAIDIKNFGKLSSNIRVSKENIYELFEKSKIVICTASGTAIEAVSCGLSVIILASNDNLTANPLVCEGKGEIWDIAFSEGDIIEVYGRLLEFRRNNKEKIYELSIWYKENFFTEPTERNIISAFEIKGLK